MINNSGLRDRVPQTMNKFTVHKQYSSKQIKPKMITIITIVKREKKNLIESVVIQVI